MISLKKYLDRNEPEVIAVEKELDTVSATAIACYRAMLIAIGKSAVQISPVQGTELDANLRRLEHRLAVDHTVDSIKDAERQVEVQLKEWESRTSEHIKSQAEEVKELLVVLAKTAESVGSRYQGYSNQFKEVTCLLEKIADLEDLTQIRSTVVARVTELKNGIDLMNRENHQLVTHLRAEISVYETRLKSAEHLAQKDELTGLANRRNIEERIFRYIENGSEFCVVMLDLNHFKHVNDKHGHQAGDDLLKQFAKELQSNTRSGDLAGRWGGDEFVVVLLCNAQNAKANIERTRDWVFGKYTVLGPHKKPVVLHVDAAIGCAEWRPGKTLEQLIAEADASMYLSKDLSRRERA